MAIDPFCQAAVSAIGIQPSSLPEVDIDTSKGRNAAAVMTALLAQRLRKVDPAMKKLKNTTFVWKGGLVNIRNAVKNEVWTNLRLRIAEWFHLQSAKQPVLYLFACWEPGNKIMHTWSIPEGVMYEALPRFPVEKDPGKKTIRIKPGESTFETIKDSPDIEDHYRVVELGKAELGKLREAQEIDAVVRESGAEDSSGDDAADDLGVPSKCGIWKIAPGQDASIWDQCRDKAFIAIGWSGIGDFSQYKDAKALRAALRNKYGKDGGVRSVRPFFESIQQGDIVVANKGLYSIVGIGHVISDYLPHGHPDNPSTHDDLVNARRVRWLITKPVTISDDLMFGQTTVTSLRSEQWDLIRSKYLAAYPQDVEIAQAFEQLEEAFCNRIRFPIPSRTPLWKN